jgi:dTDP-4-dehydrorhamnose reductase
MRCALITGMNGTVAPVLAARLERDGWRIVAWNREAISPDDESASRRFFEGTAPDALFHLAMGGPEWAGRLAALAHESGSRLLYTSSVSVFAHTQRGPFAPDARPQPDDDYGRYKLDSERQVRAANPDAIIARLAWQIGDAPGSNNMVDYLHRQSESHGRIEASIRWFPACAFLPDTADALATLAERRQPGLYHLDGNPGLSFAEIASRLATPRGWHVEHIEGRAQHNLMTDDRITIAPITSRLGE